VNYLIDTNVISEIRKGARCDANVAHWYSGIDGTCLYLSVIVLGEIRMGVEKARRRDPAHARALEKWLLEIDKVFGDRVLSMDRAVADEWGRLSAIRTLPAVDAILAATAKIHSMTFVTRDSFDTTDLDVRVLNPFVEPRSTA
jgi:toxin FitB